MSEYPVNVFFISKNQENQDTDQIPQKARLHIGEKDISYLCESGINNSPFKRVKLLRSVSGFGISIKGGKEHNRPIYISKCDARNEGVVVGDRIVSCNGKSLLNATHREAVDAIKSNNQTNQQIEIEVQSQSFEKKTWPISPPQIYRQFDGKFWLCRLSRPKNKKYGPMSIEIAAPDLSHRLIVQNEIETHADILTSAFRKMIDEENKNNLESLNLLLKNNAVFKNSDLHWKDLNQSLSDIELKKLDWFHDKNRKTHSIMVLNNMELRLYNSLPVTWEEWDRPANILPLLGSRVTCENDTLIVRTGTRNEIEIRQFQGINLKLWEKEIKEASRAYVDKVEEALVEIIHNDATAFLGMHRSEGLKLYTVKDEKRKLEWTKHASAITEIDDSSENTLKLKFNDKTQYKFVLGDGLRPFIFLIFNFLEAQATSCTSNHG
jgi:hypothetical protein